MRYSISTVRMKTIFRIYILKIENITVKKLEILNSEGIVLFSKDHSDFIDISSEKSGLYFLRINNSIIKKIIKKIVKN
jgi:hypothetical protein